MCALIWTVGDNGFKCWRSFFAQWDGHVHTNTISVRERCPYQMGPLNYVTREAIMWSGSNVVPLTSNLLFLVGHNDSESVCFCRTNCLEQTILCGELKQFSRTCWNQMFIKSPFSHVPLICSQEPRVIDWSLPFFCRFVQTVQIDSTKHLLTFVSGWP